MNGVLIKTELDKDRWEFEINPEYDELLYLLYGQREVADPRQPAIEFETFQREGSPSVYSVASTKTVERGSVLMYKIGELDFDGNKVKHKVKWNDYLYNYKPHQSDFPD